MMRGTDRWAKLSGRLDFQMASFASTIWRDSFFGCEYVMPYDNLQDFLKALESAGELRRVRAEVDPVLEVAEIADRVSKSDGAKNQALLFERVAGSALPLAINTFGSYGRM